MPPRLSIAARIASGLAGCVFVAAGLIAAIATAGTVQSVAARTALVGAAAAASAVTVFVVGSRLLRGQLRALQQLAAAIDSVELDGSPLYRNLPERGPAEIERIVAAWNGFALRFDILIHNLRSATTRLNERTQLLATVGPHAARRAELQAEALRQLVEQFPAPDARGGDAPANAAVGSADEAAPADGHAAATATLASLGDDGAKAEELWRAVASIGAEATLLGLNAAIATVQAGASGRAFAPVAEELRALAKRLAELVGRYEAPVARLRQLPELLGARTPGDGNASPPDRAGGSGRDAETDVERTLRGVAERLLAEATTVAQRTAELAATASAAATAAAEVEAQVWPPPEIDGRDIVRIGEARRVASAT